MSAPILNRPPSAGMDALLRWMDPPRPAVSLDGVVQPSCSSGAHVVANVPMAPEVSRAVAGAIDEWLLLGRLGTPALPPGIPPDVMRVIGARLSGMAMPKMARPLSKAITHREVHTGRTGKQGKGKTPKWRKDGLVGPGGAWAVAQRAAKDRGKPKAYAVAVYNRIAKK